jgi:putative phosphoesterase
MTKLWIVSDTHRHYAPVLDCLKNDPHDVVLHLGDHAADAQEMAYYLHVPVIAVRGNCDGADGEIPLERILEYHSLRIFMTHGHGYRVKSDRRYLAAKAKKENCTLALYGHTTSRATIWRPNQLGHTHHAAISIGSAVNNCTKINGVSQAKPSLCEKKVKTTDTAHRPESDRPFEP